jgi:hypothetical protein
LTTGYPHEKSDSGQSWGPYKGFQRGEFNKPP